MLPDTWQFQGKIIYLKNYQFTGCLSGFSINQTIKKQAEETEEEERKEKDAFTFEELMIHWNQFAKDADKKNRKTLFTALTKTQPVLKDDFMIIHTLDNKPLFDNFLKGITEELYENFTQVLFFWFLYKGPT